MSEDPTLTLILDQLKRLGQLIDDLYKENDAHEKEAAAAALANERRFGTLERQLAVQAVKNTFYGSLAAIAVSAAFNALFGG
jgi:hypothetical protein